MDIKIVNTVLYCKKWDQTVAFYKKMLRLEVTASMEWFIEFKLNETSCLSIANEERTSIKSSGGRGLTITMKVDNIKEAYSYLQAAGLNPIEIRNHAWGAKVIYIYDPEGNRLEFWSESVTNH